MGVISIRLPDSLEQELEEGGIKVAAVVRKELASLAKRLRIARRTSILAKYRTTATRPVAHTVREARDEH